MFKSIEGVYRKGKIELAELPGDMNEETRVIITFLTTGSVDLQDRGIDEGHAAELRARLSTFSEDWDTPDMDVYNDYDSAKSKL